MRRYRNLSGNSGVSAFEISDGAIAVRFNTGAVYLYTAASAGSANLTSMQRLARQGRGLSSYISQAVGPCYARRLH